MVKDMFRVCCLLLGFFSSFLRPKTLTLRNEMKTLFFSVVPGETSYTSRTEFSKKCNVLPEASDLLSEELFFWYS